MARKRGKPNLPAHEARPLPAGGIASGRLAARLRAGLLLSAVALLFCSVLIPSEGSIRDGSYAALAAGWCVLGLLWACLCLLAPSEARSWGWFEGLGLAFVAWHSLAAIAWLGHGHDRQTLNALWLVVGYGLTVWLLRQAIVTAEQARALVVVLIGLAAALSVLGFEEYLLSKPALAARYDADPEAFLVANGIPTAVDAPERLRFENRLKSVEPLTTFALTNSLAGFLAPWLIVVLGIGLAAVTGRGHWQTIAAAALVAAAIGGCLLLTKSRTALLASAAGALLLVVYGRSGGWKFGWRWPALAAALATLVGLAVVFLGGLDAEVLSEAPKSLLYRLEYWRSTAALIADHPLLGCGPGNFQESYPHYKLPQASETVQDPHNFLLEIWATSGTPGLLLLLATIAGFVVDLWRWQPQPASNLTAGRTQRLMIYGGAVAGFLAAVPLAVVAGLQPAVPEWVRAIAPIPTIWCVGLPVLLAVVWLFDRWVQHGEFPLPVALVALLALAINLLAAGAFCFPGVVASALALMPVAFVAARSDDRESVQTVVRPAKPARATATAALAIGCGLLLLACWLTEYRPVLTGSLKANEAVTWMRLGRGDAAEQAALAAAAADPWWAEPWLLTAEIRHQRYLHFGEPRDLAEFAAASERYRQRNPRHHGQHFQRGNWWLLAWRKSGQRKHLEEAAAAYRKAIAHFPAQALYHAQLAWTLHLAGQSDAAREAAARALQLDAATPHADQKLRKQRLLDPQSDAGGNLRRPDSAEQTMQLLRTGNKPEAL